jgi:hypothetical protein
MIASIQNSSGLKSINVKLRSEKFSVSFLQSIESDPERKTFFSAVFAKIKFKLLLSIAINSEIKKDSI